jgi:hypothetical protein
MQTGNKSVSHMLKQDDQSASILSCKSSTSSPFGIGHVDRNALLQELCPASGSLHYQQYQAHEKHIKLIKNRLHHQHKVID